jgi:hypothetical protein
MSERTSQNKRPRKSASAEPWEVEGIHREFPTHSENELTPAIEKCKEQEPNTKNRRKLAECVSRKIR